MNRILLLLPFIAVMSAVPHAAQAKNRVGFVDVQKLVAAVPGGSNYQTLSKKADTDLAARQQTLQTLLNKANTSKSAADRTAFTKAQQAYATAQKNYQDQLAKAFKPLAAKVDAAVTSVARSNGYSVVLNRQVAARSKLVVYANDSATDLTAAVLKALKK